MRKALIALSVLILSAVCGLCLTGCASGKSEHSITCMNSENGVVIVADTKAEEGENVILAARPNAGYKLVGFSLNDKPIDGNSFVMPNCDVTVSARFDVITYSVFYVAGDTQYDGSNPAIYTVENAPELLNPTKDGYEICGWYRYFAETEHESERDIEQYRVTTLAGCEGNLTLYARYYNPMHTIDFEESENGYCFAEISTAAYGDTVEIHISPESGYELDYIKVNGEPIAAASFEMPPSDVIITAAFRPIVYSITYVLFGGTNSPDNPESYTVETGYIELFQPEKEGCYFEGWYLDEDFTEYAAYMYSYDYLRPLTLYAKFVEYEDDEGDLQA